MVTSEIESAIATVSAKTSRTFEGGFNPERNDPGPNLLLPGWYGPSLLATGRTRSSQAVGH